MRLNKDGTPDKRFKKDENVVEVTPDDVVTLSEETTVKIEQTVEDPNELHERLLRENNLTLDFDVLNGTITTKYGIIKLDKPTLVVKAKYEPSNR